MIIVGESGSGSAPQIMLDLETLSTRNNAVILSVGATFFTFDDGIIDTFYQEVRQDDLLYKRFHVDPSTLSWWATSVPDKLRKDMFDGKANQSRPSLKEVLQKFSEWVKGENGEYGSKTLVWGNGSDFDNSILGNAYNEYSIAIPWEYRNSRCYRTLLSFFEKGLVSSIRKSEIEMMASISPEVSEGWVAHNSLYDSILQTKVMLSLISKGKA